jgi:hypothetical protein
MLLSALHCTIARICIKIVRVVKVLRVRIKHFGGMTRCGETRVLRYKTVTQTTKAAEENLRKQCVCTTKAQDG